MILREAMRSGAGADVLKVLLDLFDILYTYQVILPQGVHVGFAFHLIIT